MQKSDKFRIDPTKLWSACDSKPGELIHVPISELIPTFEKIISE